MNLHPDALRPSTLAAIIADLVGDLDTSTVSAIQELEYALLVCVGEEASIDYLVDAGVTPEQMAQVYAWDGDQMYATSYPSLADLTDLSHTEIDFDADDQIDLDPATLDLADLIQQASQQRSVN